MRNLVELICHSADRAPGAQALVDGDHRLDYATLRDHVLSIAAGLAAGGLQRGDRVAVFLDKRVETVEAFFAIAAAGGVFVPVNPLLKPEQVVHILQDSGARSLVTSATRLGLLAAQAPRLPALAETFLIDAPDARLPVLGFAETRVWQALLDFAPLDRGQIDTIDSDLAAILYTSGSTGLPKGVMLTHHNLLEGAWSVATYLGNHGEDRILCALPLSFDAGFSQLTTAFHAGAAAVLVNYLAPGDVIAACERERITGITAVPPLWIQLCSASWPPAAAAQLRYFANTGGRMPKPVLAKLRELFPAARPFLMYGLTEAFRSTYLPPEEADRRPDSIGKAVPNARILVVRPDGTPCDADETGELVHVGAFVARGYWRDPERTAQRFRPSPEARPWPGMVPEQAVWSGDLVRRDSEGFLYFVGRNDGLIKTSGYRVSPEEIEETVLASGLAGEVVAVGIPDDALGQAIVLVVAPPPRGSLDAEAILTHCRQRLPSYMVPRAIHVRSTIQRNPNGKFDRAALQRELSIATEAV
ncbi:acyl-CoA ligase (AMP-forming), exosortase A system-associated [Paracidovorax citrulli]|uniref:acyl-CoA ligase (AMP-forming), exosortase A system-associated n=1 Tax=Paracidovorax citrulli TaxID=80869 RepID=UPI0002DCB04B|nr:acyl-CoA ligase (AMP-forming), exosortase A system-associated [Paracidovorax citrulli]QCX09761.1 Long-chain-fatty-acid--CoA ligase [Paracidovorax citrulli]UEG47241.1 acyl-CoA ligase (AMP-forming), exosortase A system-associated [Paracidovorax citrulli]UMT89485.1 acyl-CoA ligase (AMP-forming), exosortase A system-associated [Paracidovorax citrulli]UMT97539.1 acyl-CoA ligase (AMP-forming), exosortase A system-associated [Paracidovorax citrulli]WIY35753.1 acyl-CoA ligase (AMP-forming), exosort